FFEELARGVGTDAGLAEALLDESRKSRLNHVARLAAVGVTEGNGVDIVAACAVDAERAQDLVDHIAGAPARAGIKVGLADDLFEIRPGEQDAAEYRNLLRCVRGH